MRIAATTMLLALSFVLAACDQTPSNSSSAPEARAPTAAPTAPTVDHLSKNLINDKVPSVAAVARQENGAMVSTGKGGFMMFGPYAAFAAGTYTVKVKGFVTSLPSQGSVRLDIVSQKGKSRHGDIIVSQPGDLPSFQFTLAGPVADLEVRAQVPASAQVTIESYEVSKTR